ncbi:double-strand break repair helicase AddA [Shimia biformata]|uniref:double-strand break repair helicase AddA n=1 Tax=Shimia biformata TaxID=1294299 RepID=UPI001951AE20|nr:double-strand break repair helicase AddA [Shimia biformata]
MILRNDATESQVQAARPEVSTWLSANAGSGKTRVLTDRVARLLLAEVLPQHILCLTYTKAAASEMQNRLFRRLGEWAMKPDAELRKDLAELGYEGDIGAQRLGKARTLFARAIETPGGLKIQTIHSFCATLLRRFPLEAGVSPLFTEMEDRAGELLREEILDDMALGAQAGLVDEVALHFTGQSLVDLAGQIVGKRALFLSPPDETALAQALSLPIGTTESDIAGSVFLGSERALLANVITAMRGGSVTDQKNADKLATITRFDFGDLPVLESVFLSGSGAKEPFSAKIGSVPTKKTQSALTSDMPALDDLMRRVETARQQRIALTTARRSMALHRFGHAFLTEYEARKQDRGWLDFDDLIQRAGQLLASPGVAEWVLYRLDGGIDHILVDEAQDTSPTQWQVIESLAQEFTSGTGARDTTRTIFVVGDKKQSIYSFQGADPAEFDRMRADFAARLETIGEPLQNRVLEYSFRSSEAILRLVDACFENRAPTSFPQEMKHRAFHGDLPGRVDMWPVVDTVQAPEDGDWFDPVDRVAETHHSVILAERIASEIARMIAENETIPAQKGTDGQYEMRPVQPGDFLILVQRRSTLFHEIIRACKEAGLPIAGADRLKVGGELAVRDLAALLSFLATPEDDLSLATALKSPLFGWSEQDLFTLAHGRGKQFLWQVLRKKAQQHPKTLAILNDLLAQTDFLRPYDLIERILTRHDGRRKLLGRLGVEAEDGINALLSQALSYEKSAVPSLTGFLVWMETDDIEIKRQMDSAGNRIRVMTVHGAKGLEAPIVILPDTAHRQKRGAAAIVGVDGAAVWPGSKDETPQIIEETRAEAADRDAEERLRLLYVALTRAETWLIVAASGNLGTDGTAWYDIIEQGMTAAGAVEMDMPGGAGRRLEHGSWTGPTVEADSTSAVVLPEVPAHFRQPAPTPTQQNKTLSPSDLGGAKALAGEAGLDEEAAKLRGTWIHTLLEHLPSYAPKDWDTVSRTLLSLDEIAPKAADLPDLLAEASGVLTRPELANLFREDTLAEVSVTAALGANRIHGTIDRLVIEDDRVLAVDFKTNAVVPGDPLQVPGGLLRQMGAYAHALTQIYPDRRIDTAILWTRTAELMPIPHDLVTDALRDAQIS